MVDIKKVMKGLQCLARTKEPTSNPCADCGYIDRPNFAMCVVDVAIDALDLLKEQEAKPVELHTNAYGTRFYFCPKCKRELFHTRNLNFCEKCGQAVKWE